jgi:hypothetical protein
MSPAQRDGRWTFQQKDVVFACKDKTTQWKRQLRNLFLAEILVVKICYHKPVKTLR